MTDKPSSTPVKEQPQVVIQLHTQSQPCTQSVRSDPGTRSLHRTQHKVSQGWSPDRQCLLNTAHKARQCQEECSLQQCRPHMGSADCSHHQWCLRCSWCIHGRMWVLVQPHSGQKCMRQTPASKKVDWLAAGNNQCRKAGTDGRSMCSGPRSGSCQRCMWSMACSSVGCSGSGTCWRHTPGTQHRSSVSHSQRCMCRCCSC